MAKWEYGGAYGRYPIGPAGFTYPDGSQIAVHNIFDTLPEFMLQADLVFVDPPWNLGNLNTFYTKAERNDHLSEFEMFYLRLFECIDQIEPRTLYIEMGKEYLGEFLMLCKERYRWVTFYNSTYYRKRDNLCYIIRASSKRKKIPLDYLDEEEAIKWICENEDYACIGDLCMGTGLVGWYAYMAGKKFVGTELNYKRLAVLVERIAKEEAKS